MFEPMNVDEIVKADAFSYPYDLKVISWNIDHLCEDHIPERITEQYNLIMMDNPDIIFLQEITQNTIYTITCLFSNNYNIHTSNTEGYFNAILVKMSTEFSVYLPPNIHKFKSTMDRSLLTVGLRINEEFNILLMTSHLESMRDHSKVRKEQLMYCWKQMLDFKNHGADFVLFGGDMNIRQKEISELSGVPAKIKDVAEWHNRIFGDKRIPLNSTWDPQNNLKLKREMSVPGHFVFRFDRFYSSINENSAIMKEKSMEIEPTNYSLFGKSIVPGVEPAINPSDHWGLQCSFRISSK